MWSMSKSIQIDSKLKIMVVRASTNIYVVTEDGGDQGRCVVVVVVVIHAHAVCADDDVDDVVVVLVLVVLVLVLVLVLAIAFVCVWLMLLRRENGRVRKTRRYCCC